MESCSAELTRLVWGRSKPNLEAKQRIVAEQAKIFAAMM
jgi:hypothetical protein